METLRKKRIRLLLIFLIPYLLALLSCDPLVVRFEEYEDGILYTAKNVSISSASVDTLLVMTWNIRFGCSRIPWFGDSCGERVILSEEEVISKLTKVVEKINEWDPDILLLQEVDIESKRSAYVDQMQWLLDHTPLNYGVYASCWHAQVIPSDGLGRMNEGNTILSRWKITDEVRIQLALRDDQDALTRYFYVRPNLIKAKIDVPGMTQFYAICAHATASSIGDTKKKHLDRLKEELDQLSNTGCLFVAGGDLNTLPPGAVKTDYTADDVCPNGDDHLTDWSDYGYEVLILKNLYDDYFPAVPINTYLVDEPSYFTHSKDESIPWDRKLDYLFSNQEWIDGSDSTYQETMELSDHAPVSAKWRVSQ